VRGALDRRMVSGVASGVDRDAERLHARAGVAREDGEDVVVDLAHAAQLEIPLQRSQIDRVGRRRHRGHADRARVAAMLDDRREIGAAKRLCQIAIHPRGQTPLALSRHRVRRERNDPQTTAAEVPADFVSGFESVELRHLKVHQDDVEPARRRQRDGRASIIHDGDIVPASPENGRGHFLIDCIVLGHEDAERLPRRGRGWKRCRPMNGRG